MNASDVVFVGRGASPVAYYRIMLPAMALGIDYVGVRGLPPGLSYATGIVGGESKMPDLSEYKCVVIQQPRGDGWLRAIEMLKARGITVLAEIDDYYHGVQFVEGHGHRDAFAREELVKYETCLRAVDGLIVSTPWLAKAYRAFNKRSWVCRNGIDPARYCYELPARNATHIGWAGGTGHKMAAMPWLQATALAMAERPNTCFISIGERFADGFQVHFGPNRATSVPFCQVEQYPAAMTNIDIALGPAGQETFFKAKSDLRWLEASALGIPLIGHPQVYGGIVDRHTGFRAVTPKGVQRLLIELIDNPELRKEVGARAREWVLSRRTMSVTCADWEAPLSWALARS